LKIIFTTLFCIIITCASCSYATQKQKSNQNTLINSELKADSLRCEYLINPLGIEKNNPRLSWIVASPNRGQSQTAYHILVASGMDKLNKNQGDLWDSQKVSDEETICIFYKGRPLKSGEQCFWKVRIWGKNDIPSDWSQPATWSMGLLSPGDWRAKWIGYDTTKNNKSKFHLPPAIYLRKEFSLSKPVQRATVYASALGFYKLHINGRQAGDDFFTPGWTDYDKRIYYNTYDITDSIIQGENAVGAIVADGWYSGVIADGWYSRPPGVDIKEIHYGKFKQTKYLRTQICIEYVDGTSELIFSDNSWKASTGPILEADLFMGETYDARLEQKGWDKPGFNQAKWENVEIKSNVTAHVQAYPGVTVKKHQEIKPLKITEPEKGVFVYDMGANFAGFARCD